MSLKLIMPHINLPDRLGSLGGRLEDKGRVLVQIVSPVGPGVKAAAFVILHMDSGIFQNGYGGTTVLKRDVVFSNIYPEQAKRLAGSAISATSVSCSSFIESGNHPELNTPTYAKSAE